jgi:hypothetical protein
VINTYVSKTKGAYKMATILIIITIAFGLLVVGKIISDAIVASQVREQDDCSDSNFVI